MEVATGTDTSPPATGVDRLLAGIRRMTALADEAGGAEPIVRALAAELLAEPGGDEVQVHHLGGEEERVDVYLFDAGARIGYALPRAERPAGIGWVASTGQSFLASGPDELAASLPRLSRTGPIVGALLLPLSDRGEAEAVIVLVRRRGAPFSAAEMGHAGALVDQAATAVALSRARAEAGTDAVTGCMNHRAMRRRLDEEIGRALRAQSPLSCLLIDLDDFKQVNDVHGHPAGDALLRAVVHALVGEFRAFDRVARYGGDEFVVILPNADLDSAAAAGTRALERMRSIAIQERAGAGVSASIGVAEWHRPMNTDDLLHACDEALLRSKRQGKGRVTRAPADAT